MSRSTINGYAMDYLSWTTSLKVIVVIAVILCINLDKANAGGSGNREQ